MVDMADEGLQLVSGTVMPRGPVFQQEYQSVQLGNLRILTTVNPQENQAGCWTITLVGSQRDTELGTHSLQNVQIALTEWRGGWTDRNEVVQTVQDLGYPILL